MTLTSPGAADVVRLTALIARQRRELDRRRAQAAARSVVDMAQGMLMERLGCSAADANQQLERLARDSGTPLVELAAEVTGQQLARMPEQPSTDREPLASDELGWRRLSLAAAAMRESAGTSMGATAAGPLAAGTDPVGAPIRPGPVGTAPVDTAPAGAAPVDAGPVGTGRSSTSGESVGSGTAVMETALSEAAGHASADGDRIAAAALEEVLVPAGAVAVALWLLGPDGCLDLVGEAGLGAREAGRWGHLAPDLDCLPQRVARTGTEVLWSQGRPEDDPVPLIGSWYPGARAVLPMRASGMLVGVLVAIWPAVLPGFEPSLLRQLTALADLCAQAVSPMGAVGDLAAGHRSAWLYGLLDGLVESALFAHPVRDADGTVTDFLVGHVNDDFRDPVGRSASDLTGRPLLEVYPLAALPGGLFDRAVEVLVTGIPHHMPGGILSSLVSESGITALMDIRVARLFDGVAIAWRRVDEAERLALLLEHAERLGRIGGWEENLLSGEIRWTESAFALFGREPGSAIPLAELNAHVVPDDLFYLEQFRDTLLREKRASAAAFRIIRADDESIRQMRVFAEPVTDPAGALAAVRGAFQDVSTHYHTQLALTATRDRLADTEERVQEEHRLALRLQQAITPWSSEPVSATGLEIAARYRPAGPARLVSGDWYDTVLLPSGQVLLAVGDIAGHGIDAVTGMVEMRNCLRGFAVMGATPADVLSWLNKVACQLTDGTIGTAVCGLYDPETMELRWARAGHLAPILVRDGSASHLSLPAGLIIGADPDAGYEEVVTRLDPGDVLLLFTDGLVERRDEAIDDALATLLRVASRPLGQISDYADYLLHHGGSNTGDDACLVAVHVR